MPLTYSPNLRLTNIGDGEQSGTWGQLTNINIGTLVEQAIAGYTTVSILDANYTLTSINGAPDEARSMALNITSSVTLTATRNVICPSVSKLYVVKNATSGGQSIVIKTSAGTGITIANGATAIVLCDGTNVIDPISTKQTALGYTPVNKAGDTMSGGLSFTGSATRIQGDFSNATLASRTAFQDKTTNGPTNVGVLPNGSNATSAIYLFNNSDPTNASIAGMAIGPGNAALISSANGSGTALPLNIYVGAGSPEVARFATDGTFFVGATSVYNGGLVAKSYFSSATKALTAVTTDSTGSGYTAIAAARQNTDGSAIELWRGSSIVGQVQVSPSGTTYGTISDYRLKNNPQTLTGSGAFIDALQPKTWTWVASGATGVGFIAHEVAVVSPSSVSGEKDAVNSDGTPKYQGMEYGSAEFIANIVAELKSLRARVAALEAK
jgi:hypothetical protein